MENSQVKFRDDFRLWWPETEGDAVYGYMLNRVTDVDLAVKHCRSKAVAVQAGGYIGMWPQRLAKFFERVYTFEPVPILYEALSKNVEHLPNVVATNAMLGEKTGEARFSYKHGGCTRVKDEGTSTGMMIAIDDLKLTRCDAIFLDVERYEIPALEGGVKTIEKHWPVITVEQKADTQSVLEKWMKAHKYVLREQVHGDWIFVRELK